MKLRGYDKTYVQNLYNQINLKLSLIEVYELEDLEAALVALAQKGELTQTTLEAQLTPLINRRKIRLDEARAYISTLQAEAARLEIEANRLVLKRQYAEITPPPNSLPSGALVRPMRELALGKQKGLSASGAGAAPHPTKRTKQMPDASL